MKRIFVGCSYSSKVNYDTGEVFPEFKDRLESQLETLEGMGYEVFNALRADNYKINDPDPAEAFFLDIKELKKADVLLALVNEQVSAGLQVEIGYALAIEKEVIIAHEEEAELAWFNQAIIKAGQAKEVILPIAKDSF